MRTLGCALLLAGLLIAAPAVTPAGAACTTDAECDNGDTCSQPDLCVSGSCVLGGGGDTDNDFICDFEFDPGTDVKATKVVAKTSLVAGHDVIRGAGDFVDLGSVGGAFTTDDGIAIRTKDQLSTLAPPGDGFDVTFTFAPGDCTTLLTSISCVAASGPNRGSKIKFKRNPLALNQIKFSYKVKGLDLTKPFFGPVRIILTHDSVIHRPDLLNDCKLFLRGIKCREF